MKKQHKKNTIPTIHERDRGFIGIIDSEDTYQRLKAGRVGWKENMEPKMSDVRIPKDLFYRLMALDMEDPEPAIQKFIEYIDEALKDGCGDSASIQEWWNGMREELIRAFTVEDSAK